MFTSSQFAYGDWSKLFVHKSESKLDFRCTWLSLQRDQWQIIDSHDLKISVLYILWLNKKENKPKLSIFFFTKTEP